MKAWSELSKTMQFMVGVGAVAVPFAIYCFIGNLVYPEYHDYTFKNQSDEAAELRCGYEEWGIGTTHNRKGQSVIGDVLKRDGFSAEAEPTSSVWGWASREYFVPETATWDCYVYLPAQRAMINFTAEFTLGENGGRCSMFTWLWEKCPTITFTDEFLVNGDGIPVFPKP